jgi:hypothetical protein
MARDVICVMIPLGDVRWIGVWQRFNVLQTPENRISGVRSIIDAEFEASRAAFKRQAQEWAGLKVDPEAELFVFSSRLLFAL